MSKLAGATSSKTLLLLFMATIASLQRQTSQNTIQIASCQAQDKYIALHTVGPRWLERTWLELKYVWIITKIHPKHVCVCCVKPRAAEPGAGDHI